MLLLLPPRELVTFERACLAIRHMASYGAGLGVEKQERKLCVLESTAFFCRSSLACIPTEGPREQGLSGCAG